MKRGNVAAGGLNWTTADIASDYDRRGENVLASPHTFRDRHGDLLARATREWWEASLPQASEFPAPKLLDLCCGTGAFSIYPAKLGYEVWGVDLSPKSIAAAQRQAQINGVEDACHFQVGDALAFLSGKGMDGVAPQQFDVISICGSLYYLDLERVLPLIAERLADGGTFLSLETNGSSVPINLYRRWANRRRQHRDPQTLLGLLRASDYRKIAATFQHAELVYFDLLTLLTPLLYWNHGFAERFHGWARRWDRSLLAFKALQPLAFKTTIKGRAFRRYLHTSVPLEPSNAFTVP